MGSPPQKSPGNGSSRPDAERDRLLAAIGRAAAEHGYAGLTIERIAAYAGVDRETFDAHFETRQQGLLAAQELFVERLLGEASGACVRADPWPRRLRAGLRAVLGSLAESAALARVFAVEADAAGLALAERQLVALDDFARLMRRARGERTVPDLPAITERLLVGGVASLLRERLLREEPTATPAFEAEVAELLLIPYLGRDEARRVAAEPPAG